MVVLFHQRLAVRAAAEGAAVVVLTDAEEFATALVVVGLVISIYFRNKDFNQLQRWAIMGIVGGGLGNIIDRIFRPAGVVDFIDVKFYGLFGLERWPTFNVADSAVVVCGIMLIISFIVTSVRESKATKAENGQNSQEA